MRPFCWRKGERKQQETGQQEKHCGKSRSAEMRSDAQTKGSVCVALAKLELLRRVTEVLFDNVRVSHVTASFLVRRLRWIRRSGGQEKGALSVSARRERRHHGGVLREGAFLKEGVLEGLKRGDSFGGVRSKQSADSIRLDSIRLCEKVSKKRKERKKKKRGRKGRLWTLRADRIQGQRARGAETGCVVCILRV